MRELKDEIKYEFEYLLDLIILEILVGHQRDKKLRKQKLSDISSGYFNQRYISIPRNILLNNSNFESFEDYFYFLKNIYGRISLGFDFDSTRLTVKSFKNILRKNLIENIEHRFNLSEIIKNKVENEGIVFIDEIDKISTSKQNSNNSKSPSTDGVQRDLLPIVEGTQIKTKNKNKNT